ncbi:MAG: PfkB family carbohydrate kinase [Acidobacteria bacterium]|nr:PfkB family carbohydrate kinase [Acidobacteriota bacterium]MDA1235897.1 PfkB family carbohydrate kinase [Acidobacteriota bacterium]
MPEKFDLVGVGLNATDTLLIVPRFPAYGGKEPFEEEMISVGGQVSSAVVTGQRLGLRTKYVGTVGNDQRGEIQLASLRQEGVNVDDVQVRAGLPTQSAYIIIDRQTGERTVLWRRDDGLAMRPEEVQPSWIEGAGLLHIDGHDTPAVGKAARLARERGIPVTVDVDTIYDGFDKVLPNVDYLIGSSNFPEQWTRERDPFEALTRIQKEFGMKVAAMTLGSHGALARFDGRFYYSPAFVVDCVDTTGAGDVFHGAFCYGVLKEWPLHQVLEFSNAMAALNCQALGARGGIGKLAEAERMLAQGQRRADSEVQLRANAKL